MQTNNEKTYYESKLQYYVVTISGIIACSFLLLTSDGKNIDDFQHASSALALPFIFIFAVGLVFTLLYLPSRITLNPNGFLYKKGWKRLSVDWVDVKGIHANPAPRSYSHNQTSTSFLIETTKGVTGYIDRTTIKIKDHYSPFVSSGEELIAELSRYSQKSLTVGTYSELRDSKNKKLNWIIVIVLLVAIAVSFYFITNIQ